MKYLFLFLVVFLSALHTPAAQNICTGNLGENIFVAGDFGSGPDRILQSDPGIAPGYIYSTATRSPDDGYYQIISNTNVWTFKFGTWLELQDNSDDPDGYMMLVNASFEPGIFFEQTIEDLCENTLYEFSADIINVIQRNVSNHIFPDVSFFLDDELFFTTGAILQTEQWNKYGFTFTTGPGQTTLKLTLRNNAPGGIGNDLALDNISFRPCGPDAFVNAEQTLTLCENSTSVSVFAAIEGSNEDIFLQWQISYDTGINWEDIDGARGLEIIHEIFTPGEYTYRYLSAYAAENLLNQKCRIISDYITIEVLPITFEVNDTVCENTGYFFDDEFLFDEGIYVGEFVGKSGCDSIVTLNLEVVPDPGLELAIQSTDPSCHGYEDGVIEIVEVEFGQPPFSYLINGSEAFSPRFDNLSAGDYYIEVFDRFGCQAELLTALGQPDPLSSTPMRDTSIRLGETLDLEIISNYILNTVSWEGDGLIYCTSCNPVSLLPGQTDNIRIVIESENGCIAADTFTVFVDESLSVYIPNVISPDSPFPNNLFTAYSFEQSVSQIEEMLIFDRWGNLVFQVQNIPPNASEAGWDGTFNGEPALAGVYVYHVELLLLNGITRSRSGTVTLVK